MHKSENFTQRQLARLILCLCSSIEQDELKLPSCLSLLLIAHAT